MSYRPPDWLNAEDREREEQLVQALRSVLTASRALLDRVKTEHHLDGWRWRVSAITGEALANARKLEAVPTPEPETAAPPEAA